MKGWSSASFDLYVLSNDALWWQREFGTLSLKVGLNVDGDGKLLDQI